MWLNLDACAELTEQVDSKVVLSDVLKQGGEDGQQCHRGVVDVLRNALHLRARVGELPQLQVLQGLLQVLRGVLEERPQAQPHHLGARLHDRPERWGEAGWQNLKDGQSILLRL